MLQFGYSAFVVRSCKDLTKSQQLVESYCDGTQGVSLADGVCAPVWKDLFKDLRGAFRPVGTGFS